MIDVGISGILGRMGRRIYRLLQEREDMRLKTAIEGPQSAHLQQRLSEVLAHSDDDVMIMDSLEDPCDVVIDFSSPEGARHRAQECTQLSTPLVVGTTGLEKLDRDRLASAGEAIPVVAESNMSVGMNLLFELAPELVEKLGESFDIEIVEHHHRKKVDAPSGTALTLAEHVAEARELDPEEDVVYGRQGEVGQRSRDEIGIHAVRGGSENGTHRLILAGDNESIEIKHSALNRDVFARGALRAAEFAASAEPGFYSMQDVLNA